MPPSLRILGTRVDPVTIENALARLSEYLRSNTPHHVITGNTLMLLAAESDPELREILDQAALVIPESWGLHWASRVLGQPIRDYTPGIDFMLAACRLAEDGGCPVYLLGAAPGVARLAQESLRTSFPRLTIVGAEHGFFAPEETDALLRRIREARPSLLFVGMGMPAQEKWIARNLEALEVPVVMGVGGSFDVLSGRLKRAPAWMRRGGIEWLYRVSQEPWRWRRIAQLPIFVGKVLKEKWSLPS